MGHTKISMTSVRISTKIFTWNLLKTQNDEDVFRDILPSLKKPTCLALPPPPIRNIRGGGGISSLTRPDRTGVDQICPAGPVRGWTHPSYPFCIQLTWESMFPHQYSHMFFYLLLIIIFACYASRWPNPMSGSGAHPSVSHALSGGHHGGCNSLLNPISLFDGWPIDGCCKITHMCGEKVNPN